MFPSILYSINQKLIKHHLKLDNPGRDINADITMNNKVMVDTIFPYIDILMLEKIVSLYNPINTH